jgi:hypothetical protein
MRQLHEMHPQNTTTERQTTMNTMNIQEHQASARYRAVWCAQMAADMGPDADKVRVMAAYLRAATAYLRAAKADSWETFSPLHTSACEARSRAGRLALEAAFNQ